MRKLVCMLALLTVSGGCAHTWPWTTPAGPIKAQQTRASFYDPYGDTAAGPTIDGGRPLGYQKPLSGTKKTRVLNDLWFGS